MNSRPTRSRPLVACLAVASLTLSPRPAEAQPGDSLLNGALVGAAIGAGGGIAFTHAVRDSDLTAGQYARGALIFGAIGAGAGLGVDALLSQTWAPGSVPSKRVSIAPVFWRDISGVVLRWRW
jgi:hypothetical protein